MRWHWSYKSLPELAGLPDADKERVWERGSRRAARRPAVWLAAAAQAAVVLVGSQLVAPMLKAGLPAWLTVAAVAVVGGVAALGLVQTVLHTARPYLLRELPGRCRGCGYDMTGNTSGACPECGRAVAAKGDA